MQYSLDDFYWRSVIQVSRNRWHNFPLGGIRLCGLDLIPYYKTYKVHLMKSLQISTMATFKSNTNTEARYRYVISLIQKMKSPRKIMAYCAQKPIQMLFLVYSEIDKMARPYFDEEYVHFYNNWGIWRNQEVCACMQHFRNIITEKQKDWQERC